MRCKTSTADLNVMNGKKHDSNSNLKKQLRENKMTEE